MSRCVNPANMGVIAILVVMAWKRQGMQLVHRGHDATHGLGMVFSGRRGLGVAVTAVVAALSACTNI